MHNAKLCMGRFIMYKEMFSKKLQKAREESGFTQREVCEATRIKQSTLASYETGRTQPDLENLGILADFYEVDVNWLLGTKGRPSEDNFQFKSKRKDDYKTA
jgi:transcriptional regulator with XRE-family HTH domain